MKGKPATLTCWDNTHTLSAAWCIPAAPSHLCKDLIRCGFMDTANHVILKWLLLTIHFMYCTFTNADEWKCGCSAELNAMSWKELNVKEFVLNESTDGCFLRIAHFLSADTVYVRNFTIIWGILAHWCPALHENNLCSFDMYASFRLVRMKSGSIIWLQALRFNSTNNSLSASK